MNGESLGVLRESRGERMRVTEGHRFRTINIENLCTFHRFLYWNEGEKVQRRALPIIIHS